MISTQNTSSLPDIDTLKRICKAISVLDAILSQEWEYRYYSYISNWDKHEECFQMRNGCGDEMHILFCRDGCVINGYAHEFNQQDKENLTQNLPSNFSEFIFGEPVKSVGTTFCIWTTEFNNWQVGLISDYEDNSEEMLNIFDGLPQTYLNWATAYFEGSYKDSGIPLEAVSKIYAGQTLTKEIILSIVDGIEDWNQIESDLTEINYAYDFSS